jgi:hypothetical protein
MDMCGFQGLRTPIATFADTVARHPLLACEQVDGVSDARSQVAMEFANGAFKCRHARAPVSATTHRDYFGIPWLKAS